MTASLSSRAQMSRGARTAGAIKIVLAALALAVGLFVDSNKARSEGRPIPGEMSGLLPGGPSGPTIPPGGGVGGPAGPSAPSVDSLWQEITNEREAFRQKFWGEGSTQQDIYRLWLAREAARYSWQITGQAQEDERARQAQAKIEAKQRASWNGMKALYQRNIARLNAFAAANPGSADQCRKLIATLREWYGSEAAWANSNYGLKSAKYNGFPQITRIRPLSEVELKNFLDPNNLGSESLR
jgi:hypothetical protein